MAKFSFVPTTLKELLSTRYFTVPRYQRSYSWTIDEINDFWTDVRDAAHDDSEYFLGNVVLTEDEKVANVYSIIDGQQRLVTTTILLAAMRDFYRRQNRNEVADAIQNVEICPLDTATYERTPRIQMNAIDNPFYSSYILKSEAVAAEKESHRLIEGAKSRFDTLLDELVVASPATWAQEVSSISRFLQNHARVVSVYAATDADAFVIFETLNDRGADLTIADLLKNYLFSKSDKEIETVQNSWIEAMALLQEYQNEDQFITFLRHYWSSVYGMTRERDLYRSIKKKINDRDSAVKFSLELKKAARLYGAALSADSDFWNGYADRTKNVIKLLPRMKLEQNRPLLLAIFQHFEKVEVEKTLRLLLGWSIRGLIGGVMGKGAAETAFCEAATSIRAGTVKNSDDLKGKLSNLIPGDTSFERSFETFRTTNSALARYLLLAFETADTAGPEPEFVPNENVDDVNLEHILPQRAKRLDWPQFHADEVTFFATRISNMTLLQKGKNSQIGNKSWMVKKPVIAASNYRINKSIGAQALWDKDAIDDRGRALARKVCGIWPL